MVGEVIKSYLVSLGVEIDQPGFNQMNKTLNQTNQVVASAVSGWTKQFSAAGAIIATAIAGVTTASAGLMANAAKQDLAMEKYARSMLVGKNAAMEMKLAVDALGESVTDIQLTPELMGRYGALVADGRRMKVGGDYGEQMKGIRDLLFEFTRLKQEAAYAMQWVGYYLTKHLAKPLSEAKRMFQEINGNLIKSMPVWTDKIARGLAHVVNIGMSFFRLLKNVGKGLYEIWDSFPRGTQMAIASIGALFAFINASPIGRFVALLGTMLLLVEDYFGYMDGKNAALGPIWDKLNDAMDMAKVKLKEWGELIAPAWNEFTAGFVQTKKQLAAFSELLAPVGKEFGKHLTSAESNVKVLGKAIYGLGKEALGFASSALDDFQKALQRHEIAEKFSGVLERLCHNFEDLTRWTGKCVDAVSAWLRELRDDEAVRDFLDAVAELCGALLELFAALNDLVTVALSAFFGEMDKTDKVYTFRDAMKSIVEVLTELIRCVSGVIKGLTDLFKMMTDSKQFTEFWKELSREVDSFSNSVFKALDGVGSLGKKMIGLAKSGVKKASNFIDEVVFGRAEASGTKGETQGLDEKEQAAEPYIQEAAEKYNLDPNLLRALIKTESAFRPDAESGVGAYGYTQLMPETAEWLGVNINDPRDNIMGGAKYLKWLLDYFDGNIEKAVAGYNAGQGAVDEYGGIPPFEETIQYVPKVMDSWKDYRSRTIYKEDTKSDLQVNLPINEEIKNPPEDMRNPDEKSVIEEIGDGLTRAGDYVKEGLSEFGRYILDSLGYGDSSEASVSANSVLAFDPYLLNSLAGRNVPLYDSIGYNNTRNLTYQIDVGGVNVQNTNAAPADIGKAVAGECLFALENQAIYTQISRAIT